MRKPRVNEMLILGALSRHAGWARLTPTGIARSKGFPDRQMTDAFRRLEDRGLVDSRRDASCRAVTQSRITPAGRSLLDQWHGLIFGATQ